MKILGNDKIQLFNKINPKYLPNLHTNSGFFEVSEKIEQVDDWGPLTSSTRTQFEYNEPLELVPHKEEKSTGTILEIDLHLSGLSNSKITKPKIYVLGTPENNAISMGRLYLNEDDNLKFQLARYHTGIPAQYDLKIAYQQAAQIPYLKNRFSELDDMEEEMFITYLTREGQLIDWQTALFEAYGKNIPTTIAHGEHAKADIEGFGRFAKICPINYEGLDPKNVKILTVTDNTASGMQQVALLEQILSDLEEKGGGQNLEEIIVISPLLTLYGAATIALWAEEVAELPITFIASGGVLGCIEPERYYSPLLLSTDYVADNGELLKKIKQAYGDLAEKICSRCNWTSSFLAPDVAMKDSNIELSSFDKTNDHLKRQANELDFKDKRLIPYSTWIEAIKNNKTDKLL